MKILVTGTAGFIGFHLAEKLLSEGHDVIGIDNINSYYDVNLKKNRLLFSGIQVRHKMDGGIRSIKNDKYKFYKCRLENKEAISKIFKTEQPDAVCHLAAQAGVRYSLKNPDTYIQSNIVGFQNIIESCRNFGILNFSYASSSSVYGGNTDLPFKVSDRSDSPLSLYAATKKSNELVAYTYSNLFGIRCTGMRFFTVYGPWGRPDMALFLFAEALRKNKYIKVYNNGQMKRDFTFIDDIIEGIYFIIKKPALNSDNSKDENINIVPNKIYNIGNNNPVKLMDFIESIEFVFGKKFKMKMMPIQPGDVPDTFADIDPLINDFDYKPRTNLKDGIFYFKKWYNEYYKNLI